MANGSIVLQVSTSQFDGDVRAATDLKQLGSIGGLTDREQLLVARAIELHSASLTSAQRVAAEAARQSLGEMAALSDMLKSSDEAFVAMKRQLEGRLATVTKLVMA